MNRCDLKALLNDPKFSIYREKLLEHLFVSELVQAAWLKGKLIIVSKSEIDAWGHDIVISSEHVVRHIQLKAVTRDKSVPVNAKLSEIPGACIVKLFPYIEADRICLKYALFQKSPNDRLDFSVFRNVKSRYLRDASGKAIRKDRTGKFKVPISAFKKVESVEQLVDLLFSQEIKLAS